MEDPTDSLISFLESESQYTLPNLDALLIRTTDAATNATMASTVDTSSDSSTTKDIISASSTTEEPIRRNTP